MGKIKTLACPECGSAEFEHEDALGAGFRVCAECSQEWWANINYNKYRSPAFYYEVFTSLGRSLPYKDRNGDANSFDKRSVKRRVRMLERAGFSVNVILTSKRIKRSLVYSSYSNQKIDLLGVHKKPKNFSLSEEI